MTNLSPILSFAGAAMIIALIILHLVKSERKPQRTFFIIAGALLALEQISLGVIQTSRDPLTLLQLVRPLLFGALVFPVYGLPFFLVFGKRDEEKLAAKYLPWIILGTLIAGGTALALPPHIFIREIHFVKGGPFWGFTVTGWGKMAGAYLLLTNVFFLYFIENTYRAANLPDKVTLKYPLLGILVVSAINFVVMGRMLALSYIDEYFLAVHSVGVIVLCLTFLFATWRYKLFNVHVYIGRRFAASVVAIVVSAAYFLALAIITYFAKTFGLPYDRLTLTVLGLFAAFLLLAVLISGKAKRRVRQFIDENFYLNRYDYRNEWRKYAELMAHSVSVDELALNVVTSLCETILAKRGIVCVSASCSTQAVHGHIEEKVDDDTLKRLMELLGRETVMISRKPLFTGSLGSGTAAPTWIHAVALLGIPEDPIGAIALGEKHLNTSYTEEDRNFIETVAVQTTAALESLFMEEKIRESRQMEAFTRFASFIIHDLKNAVGMLSLTAENAKENIGNVDFQRDAIDTIDRSVQKIRQLIDSLKAFEEPVSKTKAEVDLGTLVTRAVEPLKQIADTHGITLQCEIESSGTALVDAGAMHRVIENIVLNGIEAGHGGGTVSVRVSAPDGERIAIVVRDDGGGFDPDYMKRHLFSPFQSTKKGGLGIGLVLCKTIIDSHGGRLHIESEPGLGATVTIQIHGTGRPGPESSEKER
jgi:putative PEP-CTERM system histidine kinase